MTDDTTNNDEPTGDDTDEEPAESSPREDLRKAKEKFAKAQASYAKAQEAWSTARRKFTETIAR